MSFFFFEGVVSMRASLESVFKSAIMVVLGDFVKRMPRGQIISLMG